MDRNLDGDDSAIGTGDERLHYHQDALFSVYAVTDESGEIAESYLYDPYGEVTVFDANGDIVPDHPWGAANSLIDNPYVFTGRRFDEETGLYYFRARYFDADQGRFISRDPLGYVDGMSLYQAYFVPNGVDPTGEYDGYWVCVGRTFVMEAKIALCVGAAIAACFAVPAACLSELGVFTGRLKCYGAILAAAGGVPLVCIAMAEYGMFYYETCM